MFFNRKERDNAHLKKKGIRFFNHKPHNCEKRRIAFSIRHFHHKSRFSTKLFENRDLLTVPGGIIIEFGKRKIGASYKDTPTGPSDRT